MAITMTLQEELIEKLKSLSESELRQIMGYVDGIVDSRVYQQNLNYELTDAQKSELDKRKKNMKREELISSEMLHKSLYKKV